MTTTGPADARGDRPRFVMHVGMPKTGTSLLQSLLRTNAGPLREQGWHQPGGHLLHHRAASQLNGIKGPREDAVPEGQWERVVELVHDSEGDCVVSNERYSLLKPEAIARVLEDLDGWDVHVVLTVRDLVAGEYSRWQEDVKNGDVMSWPELVDRASGDLEWMRHKQRIRRTVTWWSEALPGSHLHLVTMPPPDAPRHLLPQRFADAVGMPLEAFTREPPQRANTSLDPVGVELVRRLNLGRDLVDVWSFHSEIKLWLAAGGELSRDRDVPTPVPHGEYYDRTREEAEWVVEHVTRHGWSVHGDLADLTSVAKPDAAPEPVTDQQVLAKALEAIGLLATRSHRRSLELDEAQQRQAAQDDSRGVEGVGGVDPGARMPRRVAQAVRREVRRHRGT